MHPGCMVANKSVGQHSLPSSQEEAFLDVPAAITGILAQPYALSTKGCSAVISKQHIIFACEAPEC